MNDTGSVLSGVSLSRLCAGDLDVLVKIEASCFTFPWSRAGLESEIARHSNVAARDASGRLVGYLFYAQVLDELQILNIAVEPGSRSRGVGATMLAEVLRRAEELGVGRFFLEVRPSNAAALRLYGKFGFRETGVRPRYYSDGENALLMTRTLEPQEPGT